MKNFGIGLLTKKNFAPLFWTQFSVAFNDNVFRSALLLSITFSQTSSSLPIDVMTNLCAALFTLPYLLFSSLAGQLTDKFDKARLVTYIKFVEIILTAVIFIGFQLESNFILISTLFLFGTHSAFFGPIKYSILPCHLKSSELIGGNGLIEFGTFVAILLGTITGGVLMSLNHYAGWWVSGILFIFAVFGWLTSLQIPKTSAARPELKINWNIFQTTLNLMQIISQNKTILAATLGISWFWGFGLIYLTQVPNFVSSYLHSNAHVATLLLSVYSVGIGIGSISCEKLSPYKGLHLGILPAAALGMIPFAFDLAWLYYPVVPETTTTLLNIPGFLANPSSWRVMLDLFCIAFFNGLFAVPLYVLVQRQAPQEQRGQIIAAGNVINTICMMGTTFIAMFLFQLHFSIPQVFLVFVGLQFIVSLICYWMLSVDCLRFMGWIVCNFVYKISLKGLENIPEHGPAVIACNHISYIDPMIIFSASPRPIRFVMDNTLYRLPIFNIIFRHARAIPITSARENPQLLAAAYEEIEKALNNGEAIGIFPEGMLTRNGRLNRFQPGIMKIISRTPAPVIPMAIDGLWGSFFSWRYGKAMFHWPRKFFAFFSFTPSKVSITSVPQLEPNEVGLDVLYKKIGEILSTK